MRRASCAAIALLSAVTMACTASDTPQTITAPTPAGTTSVFSGTIVTGGTATRSFEAALTGTASATFEFLDQAGVTLQLGMGIPRLNGAGCFLSRAITVAPGAGSAIAMPVESGTFCVQLADTSAQIARVAAFRVTISAP